MTRLLPTVLVITGVIVAGCSTTTPKEHSKAAYRKYSLQCVARGISEYTPAHTECVVDNYANAAKEHKRSEVMIEKLVADSKKQATKMPKKSINTEK